MGGVIFVAVLALVLLAPPPGGVVRADDDDLAKGVALVDDGAYDAAILVLDTAARRLAEDPKRTAELRCPGTYTRTSNTTATYAFQAVQETYLISPYNNSNLSDTYTLVVLFP